jgi:UDPglucose 6-dehydrogenase
MQKIVVVGTGYVGLISGLCFVKLGHHVVCVDKNPTIVQKLQAGQMTLFEDGGDQLLQEGLATKRLAFDTTAAPHLSDADIVLIAVGTPQSDSGEADLGALWGCVEELTPHLQAGTVLLIKSTVPVGTNRLVQARIRQANCDEVIVASNPEFLREGCAINDFMKPDRIVIGTDSGHPIASLDRLYNHFRKSGVPVLLTTWETAELSKYASNAFLAMKIAFINEMATLCDRVGGDVGRVSQILGLDHRIGSHFLQAGPGYGGSCFPKDTHALQALGSKQNVSLTLTSAVIQSNKQRKAYVAEHILEKLGKNVAGKTLAIWGVTFKARTDDLRDSPSLTVIPELQNRGIHIRIFDPQGQIGGREIFSDVDWCDSCEEAAQDSDAVVILTEWPCFREVDWKTLKTQLKTPLVFDFRNLYDPARMARDGISYMATGRGCVALPLLESSQEEEATAVKKIWSCCG